MHWEVRLRGLAFCATIRRATGSRQHLRPGSDRRTPGKHIEQRHRPSGRPSAAAIFIADCGVNGEES